MAAAVFRRKRLFLVSFGTITCHHSWPGAVAPKSLPVPHEDPRKNTRADVVITPEATNATSGSGEVTESQINSEIALLTSKDLLEQVVIQSGLDKASHVQVLGSTTRHRLKEAVLQLEKDLEIEATKKAEIIEVRYTAKSPEAAALVLQTLANLYLEKHLKLHRPAGTQEFFQTQTDQYSRAAKERQKTTWQHFNDSRISPRWNRRSS